MVSNANSSPDAVENRETSATENHDRQRSEADSSVGTATRRGMLAVGAFGAGTMLGGVGTDTAVASHKSGNARIREIATPGNIQSTINDLYNNHYKGYVYLDPTESYQIDGIDIPPYITLDLNNAEVEAGSDTNLFEIAPAGHLTGGYIDIAGSGVSDSFSSNAIRCRPSYWTDWGGSSLMADKNAPNHWELYDNDGNTIYWRCRGPLSDLRIKGPRTEQYSTGIKFFTAITGMAFLTVSNVYLSGFYTGITLRADDQLDDDTNGWINSNTFHNVAIEDPTHTGVILTGDSREGWGSQILANNFSNFMLQPKSGGENPEDGTHVGIQIENGAGNRWHGMFWDPQKIYEHTMLLKSGTPGADNGNVFITNQWNVDSLRDKFKNETSNQMNGIIGHAEASNMAKYEYDHYDAGYVGIDGRDEKGKSNGTYIGAHGSKDGSDIPLDDAIHVGADPLKHTVEIAGNAFDHNDNTQTWTSRIGWKKVGMYSNTTKETDGDGRKQLIMCYVNDFTLTLKSGDLTQGNHIVVKDTTGNAGSNSITIDTAGSSNIDGGSSVSLNSDYGAVDLFSDGDNWYTV